MTGAWSESGEHGDRREVDRYEFFEGGLLAVLSIDLIAVTALICVAAYLAVGSDATLTVPLWLAFVSFATLCFALVGIPPVLRRRPPARAYLTSGMAIALGGVSHAVGCVIIAGLVGAPDMSWWIVFVGGEALTVAYLALIIGRRRIVESPVASRTGVRPVGSRGSDS